METVWVLQKREKFLNPVGNRNLIPRSSLIRLVALPTELSLQEKENGNLEIQVAGKYRQWFTGAEVEEIEAEGK